MKLPTVIVESLSHRCTGTTYTDGPTSTDRDDIADKNSWWYLKDGTTELVNAAAIMMAAARDSEILYTIILYHEEMGNTEDDSTRDQVNIRRLIGRRKHETTS